jgi:carbon monoxide dehydrogenase subunit G
MELTNDFLVPVPVERAWEVLTDLEQIAPCLPGAQLTSIEDDTYHGTVTVKVGPIVATYEGTAKFRSRDEATHTVVLDAAGRDRRQGKASATITATMETGAGGGTNVSLVTDLTISGKVAQFGRGVLADVSEKLLGEFVTNLERDVLGGGAAPTHVLVATEPAPAPADSPATDATSSGAGAARHLDTGPVEPVDLLDAAGGSVLKRILPIIGVFIAVFAFRRLLRGTRGLPDVDVKGLTGTSEVS